MTARLGPYLIGSAGPHLANLAVWQPRVITILDPSAADLRALRSACPNSLLLARIYVPDSEVNDRIKSDPIAAAAWTDARIRAHPAFGLWNYVHIANEVLQDCASLPLLNAYECARMQLAGVAYQCGILAFSVGNPDLNDWPLVYPALALAEQRGDVALVHQYAWPDFATPDPSWYVARLERRVLPSLPYPGLQFIVEEFGLDQLLTGVVGGWQTSSARAFSGIPTPMLRERMANYAVLRARDDLSVVPRGLTRGANLTGERYAALLAEAVNAVPTERILGYTVFCCGVSHPWETYDIAGAASSALARLTDTPTIPPEVNPMSDPRAANCRAFHVNAAGKVDGIQLVWTPVPSARYACASAQLIDEDAAQGNCVVTVEVLNQAGIKTAERALMTWPYGQTQSADAPIGPGNPNNQFTAESVYPSSKGVGPLGFFVGDANKQPISDIIWGYGLPDNRHISGYVVFQERGAVVVTPVTGPLPEQEPVMALGLLADKVRWWMEESMRQDEAGQSERAKAIRYSLIKLNGGLLYRLENALKSGAVRG